MVYFLVFNAFFCLLNLYLHKSTVNVLRVVKMVKMNVRILRNYTRNANRALKSKLTTIEMKA